MRTQQDWPMSAESTGDKVVCSISFMLRGERIHQTRKVRHEPLTLIVWQRIIQGTDVCGNNGTGARWMIVVRKPFEPSNGLHGA